LRQDIQLSRGIKSAHWEEGQRTRSFKDEAGEQYRTRFFISCLGVLSSPTLPAIPDIGNFKGQFFHTSRRPKPLKISRDFARKRIGVSGTGATGIQTITEVAKVPTIESLKVFQRTPNWPPPLRNTESTPAQMQEIKTNYDSTFKQCASTPTGFLHAADPCKSAEVPQEERVAL
jgi:cation diffusion facilitator CzcD-associated flavoprotein CzcO